MKTIKFKEGILTIDTLTTMYNDIYFTSDLHFDHGNIIKYCNRPYSSKIEMNKNLISNWNAVVKFNDVVIIHGDFMFGDKKRWISILDSLNGYKILILGNHDRSTDIPEDKFLLIADILELYIYDSKATCWQNIICCHYPILCYKDQCRNSWQTFGHVHSRKNNTGNDRHLLKYLSNNQYDVGVDNNEFTPISFDSLKKIINKQNER